jgi:hypothetical protein
MNTEFFRVMLTFGGFRYGDRVRANELPPDLCRWAENKRISRHVLETS